jgi:hypothetical protein
VQNLEYINPLLLTFFFFFFPIINKQPYSSKKDQHHDLWNAETGVTSKTYWKDGMSFILRKSGSTVYMCLRGLDNFGDMLESSQFLNRSSAKAYKPSSLPVLPPAPTASVAFPKRVPLPINE